MVTYQIDIPRRLRLQIDGLPGHMRRRVKREIAKLAFNPRSEYAEELALPEFMWLTRQKAVWVHESCVLRGRATAVGIGW